jgi:hypothetical protein
VCAASKRNLSGEVTEVSVLLRFTFLWPIFYISERAATKQVSIFFFRKKIPSSWDTILARHQTQFRRTHIFAVTVRHDDVPKRCCNQLSSLPKRLSSSLRLPLRGRNRLPSEFPIRISLGQDPVGSLRQMPGFCADLLLVSLSLTDPQIQPTHMSIRKAAMSKTDDVGCLDKGPLQIPIYITSGCSRP